MFKVGSKVECVEKDLGMGKPKYLEKLRIKTVNNISRNGEYFVETKLNNYGHACSYAGVSDSSLRYSSRFKRFIKYGKEYIGK